MKKIIQKAINVLGSAALLGATVGVAAAASYPSPFTSNTAVVTGTSAAPADAIVAAGLVDNLKAAGGDDGGSVVISGESYKLEKSSTFFHLGDAMNAVVSSTVDDEDLPTLLADGTYQDDDNDEFDYSQKITLPATQLTMFEDSDYDDGEPTVGFRYVAGADVLDYTLEFNDQPLMTDLATTDMMFMGKEYYVLSVGNSGSSTVITLLDSASDTIIAEGETTTVVVDGVSYDVSISYIADGSVKFTVNGEVTNTLTTSAATYKLDDGAYIGLKEVLYSAKDTGISKAEFSIGSGKLVLTSGSDIELNEDSITDLSVTISNTTVLQSIVVNWDAEDDLFVTPSSSITMPGFEAVSLSFTGLNYPAEEEIMIEADGDDSIQLNNFPIKDGEVDINLLYRTSGDTDAAFDGLGKDATNQLVTSNTTSLTFDSDTDEYFVATYVSGDDAESYLMRATNFKIDGSDNETTFQYMKDGAWTDAKTDRKEGDTFSVGNVEIGVNAVNKVDKNVAINANASTTNFHTLYSAEGMKVYLPFTAANTTSSVTYPGAINLGSIATGMNNATAFDLIFDEEDKDDTLGGGDLINVSVGWNTQTTPEATVLSVDTENADASSVEIGDSDVYRDFTYSALATEILFDKGGDQDSVTLVYHGAEVSADVYLTSADAVTSEGGEAGVMSYLDSQSSSFSGMNLVVVGGSAINSVAADLLGGAYRGPEFTEMTGVGAGQFLIQSFDHDGARALLVAGYNAEDTEMATTYLLNEDVDTDVGMKYVGTSATEASLVVA